MARSTAAEIARRIDAIYDLILQGVSRRGIAQYAEGHGWGVSARQLDTYTRRATAELAKAAQRDKALELGKTLGQLELLFMKALAANDRAEARAVVKDRSELLGLSAAARHEHTGKDGAPTELSIAEGAKVFLAELEGQAARQEQGGEGSDG
jgi:hypothetical protein